MIAIQCDKCGKVMTNGEKFMKIFVTPSTVGKNKKEKAALIHICEKCYNEEFAEVGNGWVAYNKPDESVKSVSTTE